VNGATQLREHNAANEIASLGGSADFVAYDKAGNLPSPRLRQAGMTVVPQLPLPGYSPGYFLCTYDAWNRLTGVYTDSRSGGGTLGEYDSTDTPVALYEYDGLNRRTTKLVHDDAHGDWDRTDYYYDREWRVIEERLERDLSGGAELLPAESVYAEYVWDPHYADAPAARFRDADGYTDDNQNGVIDPAEQGDGTREEALFYVTDANHNVTAVVNADGKVVERYVYDAYGRPHVVNGDLTVDPDGLGPHSLDEWTLDPDNRSDVLNEILFSGTRLDTETNFHQVRHRYYHNTLGRWLGPDPTGYPDGMNYYEYCRSGPISATDPMGTERLETNGKDVWWVIEEPGTLWDSDVRWVWLGTKKGDRVDIKMQFPATWNAPAPKTVSYKAVEEYASKYWREHGDIHRLPRTNQDGRILMALRAVASGQTITTPSMWEITYAAADSGAGAGFHEWLYWMSRPVTWLSGEEIDCVVRWREHYWRKSGLEGSTAQVISRNAAVVSTTAFYCAGAVKAIELAATAVKAAAASKVGLALTAGVRVGWRWISDNVARASHWVQTSNSMAARPLRAIGRALRSVSECLSRRARASEGVSAGFRLTQTVARNMGTRPYLRSSLTIREIMASGNPVSDPGGFPGALRWDVPGAFNGSTGTWELVIDPTTRTVLHFLFKGDT